MAIRYKDYYETLGVPRGATDAEIKKAFRRLAREYHPDVAKNKKHAEEKFKEINEAYEVLGDPGKRRKYDQLGPNWRQGAEFQPPPGWQEFRSGPSRGRGGQNQAYDFQFSGTGFSDFFEQLFGGRGGRSGTPGFDPSAFEEESNEVRGRDVEGTILVTLTEAMHGAVRSVSVRHAGRCEACGGIGRRGAHRCGVCGGSGQAEKTNTYQVKIPPGVTEGQRLRVPGRGEAGTSGGAAGDLFLRVHLEKHPDFEVEDHNLVHEAELAPWDAVLGAKLSVPTLEGRVNIRIPAGTQNGQRFRVRGRGLPARDGAGDLIVVARLETPRHLTEEQRRLWERLAEVSKTGSGE